MTIPKGTSFNIEEDVFRRSLHAKTSIQSLATGANTRVSRYFSVHMFARAAGNRRGTTYERFPQGMPKTDGRPTDKEIRFRSTTEQGTVSSA